MERRSPPQKRIDDHAFPVRVMVRVPGRGFENLLLDIHRWLDAKVGLAGRGEDEAPHLILFPERPYDEADFLARVQAIVDRVPARAAGASSPPSLPQPSPRTRP